MISNFVHLRVHSSYSLLSSTLKLQEIIDLAKTNNMPAVALTDSDNLFGSLEFALAARKAGVQAINGLIATLKIEHIGGEVFGEILLIAKNERGYRNLLALSSYPYIKNPRDTQEHITLEDLIDHNEGLIILSAYTEGHIGQFLLEGNGSAAEEIALKIASIFGDRFYFEIMRHGLQNEKRIEKEYIKLAIKLSIPLVATNNTLFADIETHNVHDVLLCISAGVVKAESNRKTVSNQCYFKSAQEMTQLFVDLPCAIENSVYIAQRCSFIPEESLPILPRFSPEGMSEDDYIRKEAREGFEMRWAQKLAAEELANNEDTLAMRKVYDARLEYELDIICRMKFPGYFLIVSDFIRWSKANGISVGPGRGSGAGSIVAWSLQITDLDPIRFGLLFERFLNPERVSMPDFDIDFCQERREEVIRYVRGRYGDARVGQIITFGKMQAKAVIKDVSRVLGLRYEFADYLTELVPFSAVNPVTLAQAIEQVSELKQASEGRGLYNLKGEEQLIAEVLSTALILEGLHRHVSVHAAGIVIAADDLLNTVPLYQDRNSDFHTIQYSMKYAELAGLLKFDFLGLQTLTVISKCRDLLKKRSIEVDPLAIPLDDKKTFEMLSAGRSSGVFQFESIGMKDALRKLQPDCLEDLIALGALYRPGPMENIPTYIARKHGKQAVDYLHPILEDSLRETYGVIIYQEQVMEIAQRLSGYTLGAADLLRRAMGKKIKAEMEAQEELFVKGAIANNVSEVQAKEIFALVAKFAGYGFNKSHAAAYGVISYQTAYFKANYTVEFLTACLNLDINDNDKIHLFINEAKKFDIMVLPPNINLSSGAFRIEEEKIIFALGAVRNVTKHVGDTIHQEAVKNGPFKSITDFIERVPDKLINKRALENLIKAGCFDELHTSRQTLLQGVPQILAHGASHHQEKISNQFALISNKGRDLLLEELETTHRQNAFFEFESAGMFMRYHPLAQFDEAMGRHAIVKAEALHDAATVKSGASNIKLAGVVQRKDSRSSARGRFVTLNLSDHTGSYEATIFNEQVLRDYAQLLAVGSVVVLSCEAYKDLGGVRLTVTAVFDSEEFFSNKTHELTLCCKDINAVNKLLEFLQNRVADSQENSSNIDLYFCYDGKMKAKVVLNSGFNISANDLQLLRAFEDI